MEIDMQHYFHYGYGFPTSIMTSSEFNKAEKISYTDPSLDQVDEKIGFSLVNYTEDSAEHGWSTAVLRDLGEIENFGKLLTLTEFKELEKKHGFISSDLKNEFLEVLTKVGVPHLIDKVELIIYSDNY